VETIKIEKYELYANTNYGNLDGIANENNGLSAKMSLTRSDASDGCKRACSC
jgi:hypothetical protein